MNLDTDSILLIVAGLAALGTGLGVGLRGKSKKSEPPKDATKEAQAPLLVPTNPNLPLSDSQQFRLMGHPCAEHAAIVQGNKATHARIAEVKKDYVAELAELKKKEAERDKTLQTLQVEWATFRATITTEFRGLRRELRRFFNQPSPDSDTDETPES